jgi:hypothetical protein
VVAPARPHEHTWVSEEVLACPQPETYHALWRRVHAPHWHLAAGAWSGHEDDDWGLYDASNGRRIYSSEAAALAAVEQAEAALGPARRFGFLLYVAVQPCRAGVSCHAISYRAPGGWDPGYADVVWPGHVWLDDVYHDVIPGPDGALDPDARDGGAREGGAS